MNAKIPYCEDDKCDSPVSLYAATKKSNELMAYSYSHLYGIQSTCLRFFTVYGPYGRPDMAPMLFANAIFNGKPISVFNNGEMERDFTFIDDIVRGVVNATVGVSNGHSKFSVLNIGNGAPVKLLDFISMLEKKLNKVAVKEYLPMQPGDVFKTWADQNKLMNTIGYKPTTSLECGVEKFVSWFIEYYKN
jgi:UDP-glucuronate 4-epimerase